MTDSSDLDLDAEEPKRYLPRREILMAAEEATCTERNAQYGEPFDVMERHVGQLNALGYRGPGGRLLRPFDNAVIQNALKQARIVGNPHHMDNWVDEAGYAGIGWEAVQFDASEEDFATWLAFTTEDWQAFKAAFGAINRILDRRRQADPPRG